MPSSDSATADVHLALAMEAAEIGAWEWDIRANRVIWSPTLERIHGLPAGSFPGTFDAYQRDIHPDDRERVLATIGRSVHERAPHHLEYRIIRPDGAVRSLEARGRLLFDEAGEPVRLIGVCTDVTARFELDRAREEAAAGLRQAERHIAERVRLASLTKDIGLALTAPGALQDTLQRCARIVVDHLGAAFARIWTLNEAEQVLELRASAGLYTHLDGPHGRVPVGRFKIGLIALERAPHLTNTVIGDPRVGDQEWARREGMVAFAGYPLISGGELVGVLAMFARHPLTETDFDGLGTVANAVAVGIARARADAEIRESEERYRFLAESAPTQVWTAAPGGALEFVNGQARAYFGADVAALEAEQQGGLVHPDDRAALEAEWTRALAAGTPMELEYRLRRHDGEYRWHMMRAHPYRDPQGRIQRWFGTNTDVHDAKLTRLAVAERAEELARLAAALQRSNQELDQFAYVASHDLKAPLRGIASLSQWIEEDLGERASASTREHLALLRSRVQRMESLIDGILQYSRAGRVAAPAETVAVADVVREVIELVGVPAQVQVDVSARVPPIVTERLLLQQVLMNLVGNALKHGGAQPGARIAIEARPDEDGALAITVADGGPGIAPAFHDRVWGIFQTLQPRDKVEGTGIGLALVKKIVEHRGGRVWLHSAEGAGATFGFTWPAEPIGGRT